MVTSKKAPRVFLSYSYDSPSHKAWVAGLASDLRRAGIDVILDQWHLAPGHDVAEFMERSIRDADRVLIICTDRYVRKAEASEGGVGYERMIVTAELLFSAGTRKFIPIVRKSRSEPRVPTMLATRRFVDLRPTRDYDHEFDKLVRELHGVTPEIPAIGENPFEVSAAASVGSTPLAPMSSRSETAASGQATHRPFAVTDPAFMAPDDIAARVAEPHCAKCGFPLFGDDYALEPGVGYVHPYSCLDDG